MSDYSDIERGVQWWIDRAVAAERERDDLRAKLEIARKATIEECAKVAMTAGCGNPQCMDCYGNQIAATIRDLALTDETGNSQ